MTTDGVLSQSFQLNDDATAAWHYGRSLVRVGIQLCHLSHRNSQLLKAESVGSCLGHEGEIDEEWIERTDSLPCPSVVRLIY